MKKKTYTSYYVKDQLNIDKTLIEFRYKTEKPYYKGTSCLEMGPADGVMTQFLKNHFKVLHIVDSDKTLLNIIPDYENITKFHSWFEEFSPPQKYDTIIMEHIMEHIAEPKNVLSRVYGWLNDNGVIIAGVPNAKSIHRLVAVKMGLLDSEYQLNKRDLSQGHERVYDSEKFENEFISSKFKILNKGGVFFKPVSNQQIEETWSKEMINAFYEVGKDFQENAADIFIVATKQ